MSISIDIKTLLFIPMLLKARAGFNRRGEKNEKIGKIGKKAGKKRLEQKYSFFFIFFQFFQYLNHLEHKINTLTHKYDKKTNI